MRNDVPSRLNLEQRALYILVLIIYVQFIKRKGFLVSWQPGIQRLLVEDYTSGFARDLGVRYEFAEHSRLGISLDNHNTVVVLQTHGDASAGLVDGELAWQVTTGGNFLQQRERSISLNSVVDERVRLNRPSCTKGRDAEVQITDRGRNQELVIGLCISVVSRCNQN